MTMLQVVKKWTIIVTMKSTGRLTFYIHDNFYGNMLRKLAELSFPEEPTHVEIQG